AGSATRSAIRTRSPPSLTTSKRKFSTNSTTRACSTPGTETIPLSARSARTCPSGGSAAGDAPRRVDEWLQVEVVPGEPVVRLEVPLPGARHHVRGEFGGRVVAGRVPPGLVREPVP